MSDLLDREAIVELLTQLGARLDRRGLAAEVYVVGGTAMLLAYNRTKLTRDVDAVTEAADVVEQEARAMARQRRDLAEDWFNSRVRPMLPRVFDADQVEVLVAPGISVTVASPRHMLAMKIRAARGDRDTEDILLLCQVLGIGSISAALAVADDIWGPGMIRDESVFLVSEALRAAGFSD
ncbi:MAG: hypothetical protein QG597_2506 [Actinomycetota bacterium]|nr:hypothetical protein [Actinomycetota bacterium]